MKWPRKAGKWRVPGNEHKYGVAAVDRRRADGILFGSVTEMRRYQELRTREKAGDLSELTCHPKYPLVVAGVQVGTYVGDFSYKEKGGGLVLEDVKGVKTAVYKLKRRLVKALYGIEIFETGVR